MSETPAESAFLVNGYQDPVIIKVIGRACFRNSAPLNDYLQQLAAQSKQRVVFDFSQCTGMDSTFLGILAGAALSLKKQSPQSSLILCGMNQRNLELIRNLGLHRLMTVDSGDFRLSFDGNSITELKPEEKSEIESARLVLKAHENLVQANAANQSKFQDVIALLKNQVEPD